MKTGVITPVALMVVIVLAILGGTLVFVGTSEYQQTGAALSGLKAGLVAEAVLEEARAVLYDLFNRPHLSLADANPPGLAERKDLLAAIQQAVAAGNKGVLPVFDRDRLDLKRRNLVARSMALASSGEISGEVSEAFVRFSGFRRLPYGSEYADRDNFYFNKTLDLDKPTDEDAVRNGLRPQDAMGYYTIHVTASVRGHRRALSAVHDMKVVNVLPPGREFVLYQVGSLAANPAQPTPEEKRHLEKDLNNDPAQPSQQSGPLRLYGRGWGRIYMRAAYTVDVEGYETGAGGQAPINLDPSRRSREPFTGASSLFHRGDGRSPVWYGWSLIPKPRAGQMPRAVLVGGTPQMRPNRAEGAWTDSLGRVITRLPILSAGGSAYLGINDDPGMLLDGDQPWFTGHRPSDPKGFSIIGDPAGHMYPSRDWAQVSLFRGVLLRKIDQQGKAAETKPYDPRPDYPQGQLARAGVTLGDPPSNPGDDWYMLPETMARARLRIKQFKQFGISWGNLARFRFGSAFSGSYKMIDYTSDKVANGVTQHHFGLHWEAPRYQPWYSAVLDGFLAIGPVFWPLAPAIVYASLVMNVVDPRSFYQTAVHPPGSEAGSRPDKKNLGYPSNFKNYERAATRWYGSLASIRSVKAWQDRVAGADKPVVLDGVIWADRLKTEEGFVYVGKGIVASQADPKKGQTVGEVAAPICAGGLPPQSAWQEEERSAAGTPAVDRTAHYLTIVYQGWGDPASGEQALIISPPPGAERDQAGMIQGSVYATDGVRPRSGMVVISGNLVCWAINKRLIPQDGTLHVAYNPRVLRREPNEPPGRAEVHRGTDWTVLAVSPKVAGFSDR